MESQDYFSTSTALQCTSNSPIVATYFIQLYLQSTDTATWSFLRVPILLDARG